MSLTAKQIRAVKDIWRSEVEWQNQVRLLNEELAKSEPDPVVVEFRTRAVQGQKEAMDAWAARIEVDLTAEEVRLIRQAQMDVIKTLRTRAALDVEDLMKSKEDYLLACGVDLNDLDKSALEFAFAFMGKGGLADKPVDLPDELIHLLRSWKQEKVQLLRQRNNIAAVAAIADELKLLTKPAWEGV